MNNAFPADPVYFFARPMHHGDNARIAARPPGC
jgi:hypothetical protein